MAWVRFAAVLLVTFVVAEASLQQPPRDHRGLTQPSGQLATEAHEAYRAGRWDAAAQKYEAALAVQPDLTGVLFFLGNCYDNLSTGARGEQRQVFLERAVLNYRHAAERDLDPKMRRLATDYLVAAYGPEKLNQPAAAIDVIERELTGNATDAATLVGLANLYERVGRHADAERALVRATETAPADVALRTQLSQFYQRRARSSRIAAPPNDGHIPPPPPAPRPGSPSEQRARAYRGGFIPPVKLKHVDPIVPDVALLANTDGIVIMEIVIDTRGQVTDARVLRSVPGLDDAAVAAVRQWQFSPTRIDGELVPVILTVSINFRR